MRSGWMQQGVITHGQTATFRCRASMSTDVFEHIESSVYDAALDPDRWPAALQSLIGALDAIGAALIARNNLTGAVDWASFVGPSAGFKQDYIDYFSKRDRYTAVLDQSSSGSLVRLTDAIPPPDLRTDEWYNDFVRKCGVGDIIGSRIHDAGSHTISLGIHWAIGRAPLAPDHLALLQRLLDPIGRAARLQHRLHGLAWKSSAALLSLDQLAAGVIVSEGDGRVLEMNGIAERIVSCGDGLTCRQGKLVARRAFETARLASLIAAAGNRSGGSIGRMAVARPSGRTPYLLTVTRLGPHLGAYNRALVLTLIIDPDARLPAPNHLTELFGLSPAESRLAIALMSGERLRDIAPHLGVEVATLRTQLSSIFRKVGVKRQSDLLQILVRIPAGAPTA
jgi:DNA-binding CsgD family transcriptional regulator